MKQMQQNHPYLLLVARALSLCLALGVFGYLVYCAHRDAREPARADDAPGPVYMPSSKAAPATLPPEIKPLPNQQLQAPPKKKKGVKKKKGPEVFIPSSKSGVLRLPAPAGEQPAG